MIKSILFKTAGAILIVGLAYCSRHWHFYFGYLWLFLFGCILLMLCCGIQVWRGGPAWRQLGITALLWLPLFILILPDEFCFNGCDHWLVLLFGIPWFWFRSMIPWLLYWGLLKLIRHWAKCVPVNREAA